MHGSSQPRRDNVLCEFPRQQAYLAVYIMSALLLLSLIFSMQRATVSATSPTHSPQWTQGPNIAHLWAHPANRNQGANFDWRQKDKIGLLELKKRTEELSFGEYFVISYRLPGPGPWTTIQRRTTNDRTYGNTVRQELWDYIDEQKLDISDARAHWHQTTLQNRPVIQYEHKGCPHVLYFSLEEWDMLACCRLWPSPSKRKVGGQTVDRGDKWTDFNLGWDGEDRKVHQVVWLRHHSGRVNTSDIDHKDGSH